MKRLLTSLLFLLISKISFADMTCVSHTSYVRYNAMFTANSYTCDSGYFLPANSVDCTACFQDATCSGGTFVFNGNKFQGLNFSRVTGVLNNACASNFPTHLFAIYKVSTYTCALGYYVPADNEGCVICPADSWCPGGTYTHNATVSQGIFTCHAGYDYNTTTGKSTATQCQIYCDTGTYVKNPGTAGYHWDDGTYYGNLNAPGYDFLEYISTSGTQYIDTGISGLNAGSWELYVQWMTTGTPAAAYATVIKAYTGEAYNAYRIITNQSSATNYYVCGNSKPNGGSVAVNNLAINQVHTGIVKNGSVIIDGTTYNTTTTGTTISASSQITLGNSTVGRIYSSWAKKDGTYVYNLIPARRKSDGAIGMYDNARGVFLANAGSGTFGAGPDVSGACENVGAGYYAPAGPVNYGSTSSRTACPAGLTTVGYGHGADSSDDCARIFHIGDNIVYMRQDKLTTPALNIQMENGDRFYINLSPTNHNMSTLHFWYDGNEYTAYDDSLFYGERDFDTGQQITQ